MDFTSYKDTKYGFTGYKDTKYGLTGYNDSNYGFTGYNDSPLCTKFQIMALPGCNLTTFLALSIVMANLDLIS
jgi:hypothetical protein